MKRLNPQTGLPFKHGFVREDGLIFGHYRCTRLGKNGYFLEEWCSQKVFKNSKTLNKKNFDTVMSTKNGHIAICFGAIKSRAKKNNIPFSLTLEHVKHIAPNVCPILGIPLGWTERNKKVKPHSPSLDKIVPELGYVDGNVQWMSHKANTMKQDANPKELILFARWILASMLPDA